MGQIQFMAILEQQRPLVMPCRGLKDTWIQKSQQVTWIQKTLRIHSIHR